MPHWWRELRVDRFWHGAVLASCMVHLCLVVAGWLLIQAPRESKQHPVIRVTLSTPPAKPIGIVLPEKVAELAVAEPPAAVSPPALVAKPLLQKPLPVAPPAPLRDPVKPLRQKSAVPPVLTPVVSTETKPADNIARSRIPAIASQPVPSQPVIVLTPPVAAFSVATPAPVVDQTVAADSLAMRDSYLMLLRERIESYKEYPLLARKGRQQGVVVVKFELSRRGELQGLVLQESSGKRLLDRAALQAVEAAAPFPELPAHLLLSETSFVIPVRFVLSR